MSRHYYSGWDYTAGVPSFPQLSATARRTKEGLAATLNLIGRTNFTREEILAIRNMLNEVLEDWNE